MDLCTASRPPRTMTGLLVTLRHNKDHQLLLHRQCAISFSTDPCAAPSYPQNQTTTTRANSSVCQNGRSLLPSQSHPYDSHLIRSSSTSVTRVLWFVPRRKSNLESCAARLARHGQNIRILQLHTCCLTADLRPQNISRTQNIGVEIHHLICVAG